MPNRILKDSICTSPNIDQLSRDAEVFFYRLLVQCDDYGRMDARLPILRAKCYPLQVDRVAAQDVGAWLDELAAAELITLYTVDGQPYLQMRTWERHQQIRAKRSKYPDMQSSDINCNQVIADAPVIQSNPIQSESESNPTQAAAAVFACWKDNMPGTMSRVLADDLGDLVDTYGADTVIRAITEAVRNNGRSIRYVSTILENWATGKPKRSSGSNGNGHRNAEEEAKAQADLRAAKSRVNTARKLGVQPAERDLKILERANGVH